MRLRSCAVSLAGLLLAGLAAAFPARAGDVAASPVVAACANPNLPAEILDGPAPGKPAAPLPVVDVAATDTAVALRLAVADDDADRDQGLMCVLHLRPRHGMIFVFAQSRDWEFWMKNTLVPLDMVWVAPDGTITHIAANVPASTRATPDDAVARRSGHGIFVIELAAGEAAADRFKVGEALRVPSLHASQ